MYLFYTWERLVIPSRERALTLLFRLSIDDGVLNDCNVQTAVQDCISELFGGIPESGLTTNVGRPTTHGEIATSESKSA
jgi:hypothetical protein